MAITATFKQECPTCGAMVSIKENMAGKKVECTKCKDKFVAELPEDEEETKPSSAKNKNGSANGKSAKGKKSTKTADEDEEIEEPDDDEEEDEDEPVQVKSGKSKSASNGKSKKAAADDDEDEEEDDDEDSPKKSKKEGGSNKLTIGLSLAVVGVLVLGVAAFFLLKGRRAPDATIVRGPGGNEQKPVQPIDDTPPPRVEPPKIEVKPAGLDDVEIAKLTNLLPNDTEQVFHPFWKDLFHPAGSLYDAVFKTPGLDDAVLSKKLGFSLLAIDDLIRAERYSSPGWKYTVIHFKEVLKETDLKTALNLKLAGAPIDGQTYYKMSDTHPWFDTLARFSFGVPLAINFVEPRKSEQPMCLYIHNPQTLIVGDETPVVAFMKAKGQFPLLSNRTAPPPSQPVIPPAGGNTGKTGGNTGMMGGNTGNPPPPPPSGGPSRKPGGLDGSKPKPADAAKPIGQAPFYRPERLVSDNPPFAGTYSPMPEPTRFSFVAEEQGQPAPAGGITLPLKFAGTVFEGKENLDTKVGLKFADYGANVAITSTYLNLTDPKSNWPWELKPNNSVEIKVNELTYQLELERPGRLVGFAKNATGMWRVSLDQTEGPIVGGKPAEIKPNTDPSMPPTPTPTPGPSQAVTRDDRYLTIKPGLKAVLDRMEARVPDSQDKVLISSSTDMEASHIVTNLPEFRDRVLRRPRQFWDITLMLNEPRPRIRLLGTTLIQHGDSQRYQLRNELTCNQEGDAKEIKQEIVESTSYTIAQFLQKLVRHEVRLPPLARETKQAAPEKENKTLGAGSSQMLVNQQANTVEFVLDLVLDNAAVGHLQTISTLTASALRVEMEVAAIKSVRHSLAKAAKTIGDKGLSERGVQPGHFPPGAFPRAKTLLIDQEPRNRVSWMAGLLPFMGQAHLYSRIKFEQSWRDPSNWMAGHTMVPQFLDPTYPDYTRRVSVGELPTEFGATHFVGIAGVGLDAAAYKRNDPATDLKRGVFSYDGSASLEEVQQGRGVSNTIMMIQAPHDGITGVSPWMAGGGATLRGVPEKNSIAPFVLSKDKNDKFIQHQGKRGTYVLMTDGTVRFIDQTVSDDVFKAMCTVKGPPPEDFNLDRNPTTPLVPAPKETIDPTPPAVKTPIKSDPPKKIVEPVKESKPAEKTPAKIPDPFKPSKPADPPSKPADKAARHSGEGRYYDPAKGFSIVPPKGWQRAAGEGNVVLKFVGPNETFGADLQVLVAPKEKRTLEKFADELKNVFTAKGHKVLSDSFSTLDGKKVYIVETSGTAQAKDTLIELTTLRFYVMGNERSAAVFFSAPPSVFPNLRKLFEECASSIQVD